MKDELTHGELMAALDLAPVPRMEKGSALRVPVQYESAIKHLAECRTLDEAQLWSAKADALAAWAKIYQSDQASLEARRLKLHAYRRMGQLADEIRPRRYIPNSNIKNRPGMMQIAPGARSLLLENGFTRDQASVVMGIKSIPAPEFQEIIESPRPSTPSMVMVKRRRNAGWVSIHRPLVNARTAMRRQNPYEMAANFESADNVPKFELVDEIIEWMTKFKSALRKRDAA